MLNSAVFLLFWGVVQLPKIKDPTIELTNRVERLTGPNAIDCGQHTATRAADSGDLNYPGREALERSLQCIREAASQDKPAWTFLGAPGIDSWFGDGLIVDRAGGVRRLSYASSACRGCPTHFHSISCDSTPILTPGVDGHLTFACESKRNTPR